MRGYRQGIHHFVLGGGGGGLLASSYLATPQCRETPYPPCTLGLGAISPRLVNPPTTTTSARGVRPPTTPRAQTSWYV